MTQACYAKSTRKGTAQLSPHSPSLSHTHFCVSVGVFFHLHALTSDEGNRGRKGWEKEGNRGCRTALGV